MNQAIQDSYDPGFQVCYGCGEHNQDGLKLKSYWDGETGVASFVTQDKHKGVPGFVYGGLTASLVDCHAIATAAAHHKQHYGADLEFMPRFVTASLHVDYHKPTPLNEHPIKLAAKIVDHSERKAVVELSCSVDGVVTATSKVVAVRIPDTMSL